MSITPHIILVTRITGTNQLDSSFIARCNNMSELRHLERYYLDSRSIGEFVTLLRLTGQGVEQVTADDAFGILDVDLSELDETR
ncbi:MAG: hypothetical protein ACFB6S_07210 [Geminicoccaceae bacterium]